MKLKVFSVYDVKIGQYLTPFFMATTGEALRGWSDVVADPKTQFHRHPEDYTLMELAEYDMDKGTFENQTVPKPIGPALEFHPSRRTASILAAQKAEGIAGGE